AIARNVEDAAQGATQASHGVDAVNRSAGQSGQAAADVLSAARDQAAQADLLRREVARFVAEVRRA
ncbi:hypothetical protein ACSTHK_23410, partial [Vibrio parahaemolyticus]